MITLVFLTIFSGVPNAQLADALRGVDDVLTARDILEMSQNPAADFAEIAADSSLSMRVRSHAVLALSQYSDEANQRRIALFSADPTAAIRLAATKVIARWASRPQLALMPEVIAAMDRSLADEDEGVQLQAVRALSVVNVANHATARATLFKAFRAATGEPLRDAIARGLARR